MRYARGKAGHQGAGKADLGLGESEARGVGGNAQIGHLHHHDRAADRPARHRGDQRFVEAHADVGDARGKILRRRFDIDAHAEMLAGMREYRDPLVTRVEAFPRLAQADGNIVIDRIALLGPVQRDNSNLIDDFVGDSIGVHEGSFVVSPVGGNKVARASSASTPSPTHFTSK